MCHGRRMQSPETGPHIECIGQPLFSSDDHFKCLIRWPDCFQDTLNNLTVHYERAMRKAITDVKIETIKAGVWQVVVPLKKTKINENGAVSFYFVFRNTCEITIPLHLTFIVFQRFDKKSCQIITKKSNNQKGFLCSQVLEKDVIGEDGCHLENIARVCCVKRSYLKVESVEFTDDIEPDRSDVRIILPELLTDNEAEKAKKCGQKIVLHLLGAIYYRKMAAETDKERIKWKERATERYEANDPQQATFSKHIKTNYGKLMQRYNEKACEEIFAFFNEGKGLNHVDLHGLFVADEDTLARDKEQLLEDESEEDAVKIINERREQGDEALRKLKERIEEFTEKMDEARKEKKTWHEVIVGAGHHSVGRQKIQPKVKEYLQKNYPRQVSDVNEGSLVLTFEEYPNDQRCFGHYYCETCKKSWQSGKSFKKKWQGCFKCYKKDKTLKKCMPVMQQPLKRGQQNHAKAGEKHGHIKQLCQVCSEGGSCST